MKEKLQTANIEDILSDFRQGKMIIMVDDVQRENEGDLLIPAECVEADHINFMAAHGRGLICLTLTDERCKQLDLPLMVSRNSVRFSTNFTVSIEAAHGVTTGISAQDRATTIRAAVKRNAVPDDIVTPGHIFPIKSQPGGVLTRAGHTEAGVDLARICGFEPASVICEILKSDGSMARLPDLVKYADEHGLLIGTIADLIHYRMQHDPTVKRVATGSLSLVQGEFKSFTYKDTDEGGVHMALVIGEIDSNKPVPVRVHVHRGLLDMAIQPDTAFLWSIEQTLSVLKQKGVGVIVMLSYHETAEELGERICQLSMPPRKRKSRQSSVNNNDLRLLGAGGQILADLGVGKVLALGKEKRTFGLSGFGLEIVEYIDHPDKL